MNWRLYSASKNTEGVVDNDLRPEVPTINKKAKKPQMEAPSIRDEQVRETLVYENGQFIDRARYKGQVQDIIVPAHLVSEVQTVTVMELLVENGPIKGIASEVMYNGL
jgi:hypothetical protein